MNSSVPTASLFFSFIQFSLYTWTSVSRMSSALSIEWSFIEMFMISPALLLFLFSSPSPSTAKLSFPLNCDAALLRPMWRMLIVNSSSNLQCLFCSSIISPNGVHTSVMESLLKLPSTGLLSETLSDLKLYSLNEPSGFISMSSDAVQLSPRFIRFTFAGRFSP